MGWVGLVWFYGISIIEGNLMPKPSANASVKNSQKSKILLLLQLLRIIIMTMHKVLHPRDDVDRLHESRKEG